MNTPPESGIPPAEVVPRHERRLPLVWLVPILAALIGIWLAVQAILAEGPTITVRFNNAESIEPGKTKIRYKEVDIGEVSRVVVAPDRRQVVVTAKLSREAASFLVDDTRFWVVRPRVSAGSISGLGTLLSGAYIGLDAGHSDRERRDFIGLEVPPVVTGDLPGREFVLDAAEIGSLDIGAQVSYRRIPVGEVTAYQLAPDGQEVTLRVFVNAPYDRYVNTNTKFWHASGVDLAIDANGLRVETQSLATVLEGGVAFGTPPGLPADTPAHAGSRFKLYRDHELAMRAPDREPRAFVLYFKDSLRGLAPGAPVDFHGIQIGEVKEINVEYAPSPGILRFPVRIDVYPERMRARYAKDSPMPGSDDAGNRRLVDQLVAGGMRAQLKFGNLLTGQMYVGLDFMPDAPKAGVDWNHQPPILPTVGGGLDALQDALTSVLHKLDRVPLDRIGSDADDALTALKRTLDDTDAMIRRIDGELTPEARALLGDARSTLGQARSTLETAQGAANQLRGTLGSAQSSLAADAPLQGELREALRQVARSAKSVAALADWLERHPESLLHGKPAGAGATAPAGTPAPAATP